MDRSCCNMYEDNFFLVPHGTEVNDMKLIECITQAVFGISTSSLVASRLPMRQSVERLPKNAEWV